MIKVNHPMSSCDMGIHIFSPLCSDTCCTCVFNVLITIFQVCPDCKGHIFGDCTN